MITTYMVCAALVAASATPPAPVFRSDNTSRVDAPVAVRRWHALSVSAEASLHGVAGNGLVVSLEPEGRLSLDAGFGWAPAGLTSGVRGRVNILNGPVRPFVGLGLSHSFGAVRQLGGLGDGAAFATVDVPHSWYGQVVAGVSYVRSGGVFALCGIGYQALFGDSNVRVRSGFITREAFVQQSARVGSGPVLSLGAGYAF